MSWHRVVILTCDLCKAELKGGGNVNATRRRAWLNGWRRLPDGRDLCHECKVGMPSAR